MCVSFFLFLLLLGSGTVIAMVEAWFFRCIRTGNNTSYTTSIVPFFLSHSFSFNIFGFYLFCTRAEISAFCFRLRLSCLCMLFLGVYLFSWLVVYLPIFLFAIRLRKHYSFILHRWFLLLFEWNAEILRGTERGRERERKGVKKADRCENENSKFRCRCDFADFNCPFVFWWGNTFVQYWQVPIFRIIII